MKALALSVLAVLAATSSYGQSLKAQIAAADAQVVRAMKAKDADTLEKIFKSASTTDFVYVENGRKQDMKTMVANMKMGFQSMKEITKATLKTLSLKQTGDKAIASRQHVMEGIMVSPDKKEHTMSFSGVSQDTYVRVNGKWLMKRMEWKSQRMLMDGKPFGTTTRG